MNNLINSILSKFYVDNLSCNLRRDKVDDWINILDNTEYSSTKYCNSFIEFTLEIKLLTMLKFKLSQGNPHLTFKHWATFHSLRASEYSILHLKSQE